MSKKVLNYAGRRPMLLALIMATTILGLLFSGWFTPTPGRAQNGSGNPQPNNESTNCDTPTKSIWCGGDAQLVLKNVTISPAAPTNAPYDCIVCVCASVSANLQWFTVASTNASQTCHTCNGSTPTNYCDAIVYTNGAAPYNITNEWWNCWWWDSTNGYGNSVPAFTFTNAATGWISFDNISAQMTTNPPACGVWVHWADNAVSGRSYAFVAADSISVSDGMWYTNSPCDTYLVAYCPSNYVTVSASPDPWIEDKYLPAGWNMSGGLATTNADGSPSRTRQLVSTGKIGPVTVTATSGCSSKSITVIVVAVGKFQYLDCSGTNWVDIGNFVIPKGKSETFKALSNPSGLPFPFSPIWGGEAEGSSGEIVGVTFNNISTSDSDLKTITCGTSCAQTVSYPNFLVCNTILAIHSNAGSGDSVTAGHAWIKVTDLTLGTTTAYGNWQIDDPRVQSYPQAASGSSVRIGIEDGWPDGYVRYFLCKPSQTTALQTYISTPASWHYWYNCSSWASGAQPNDISAWDWVLLGVDTPRAIGKSITNLESTDATSLSDPKYEQPPNCNANNGGGSGGGGSSN
jgi:hypothetical protein